MIVKEMIEQLKQLPQDMEVAMADLNPVTIIKQIDYGNGVVVISDEDEFESEEE